jgi:bifunctional UDP-N-acetylglucosamine pyrophosphorylase/glucosamine-1-phosphate N-acetyltransferase
MNIWGNIILNIKAVILAAGKGTRMKSDLPKVVHQIQGKPLVEYVIEASKEAGAVEICVVVGYQADVVKESIHHKVVYVNQYEQLGTGHAVMQAADFIGNDGMVIVLCGDTPLITGNTLRKLVEFHMKSGNAASVLTAMVDDPTGYGRIIRDENGKFVKNVEQKDAVGNELLSKEINSGMYLFNSEALQDAFGKMTLNNSQGEYYLPDTLVAIKEKGLLVDTLPIDIYEEMLGVNTPEQLEEANQIIIKR